MLHKPLRVSYITMQFPTPSEAFAAVELRALKRQGSIPSVCTFGPGHAKQDQLLAEHDLASISISHGNLSKHIAALIGMLLHPVLAARLLIFIFTQCLTSPRQLLTSVLLAPRAIQIFLQVRRERPDAVHLFWGHYPSMVGYLILKFLPEQCLSTSLGAYDLLCGYGPTKYVACNAQFVRTWSQCSVDPIASLGVSLDRILVSYRGIDFAAILASRAEEPARYRLAYAGRLIKSKSVDEVIKTFAGIHQQYNEATLHIMGDGPEHASLAALAKRLNVADSVKFLGHVNHNTLYKELSAAELFLFLSIHPSERLPNVVKEAMAAGCSCVVSETPGIRELIDDAQNGIVLSSDLHEDPVTVCNILLADDEQPLRSQLRNNATATVKRSFDAHHTVTEMISRWRDTTATPQDNTSTASLLSEASTNASYDTYSIGSIDG